MTAKKKHIRMAILFGLVLALLTLALFMVGVGSILETPLLPPNILAMAILGLILGGIGFLFFFFRLYYALGCFLIGYLAGAVLMITTFVQGVAGWEGLVGLLSFLMCLAIGLASGLIVQLIVFLVKKYRKA